MSQPQHVIVTGAAGALGRAVVEHFLNQGAHVHALDISDELLAAALADAERPTFFSSSGIYHVHHQ